MHILFLTDNFPPEVNAPASRTFEHCREWRRAGHRITVVTCAPNFPKGRVFPGYRNRPWQEEDMDGIRVIRVWTYITANEGFLRRGLDYLSFMLAAIPAACRVRGVDVVIGTSPQFFTVCAAWAVGALKGRPFVFELRDLWPESIKAVGAMDNSPIVRGLERVETFLYREAAAIVAVTQSFKSILMARGINGDKIRVVTNGVDMARFTPRTKDAELAARLDLEGCFVAGYIGTHGLAHGLETLLDAAALLREHPRGRDIRWLFLGDGARKRALRERAAALGLADTVVFVDSVPKEAVARYWSLLDIAVIHLRKTPLFASVIPSKLFECMGMGIPVLHGVAGESADLVEREGVGRVFEPENSAALAAELLALRADGDAYRELRSRCRAAAVHYDRAALAARMLEIVAETARDGAAAGACSAVGR